MELNLQGKAALVTGGAQGIGRAIALALAGEGADVGICGRSKEKIDATVEEIGALGVKAHGVVADLLVPADCERAVDETAAVLGRLDILVNNASTNVDGHSPDLEQLSDEQLLERIGTKGVGAARCARVALKHMRDAGAGSIIMMGGTSARSVPGPGGGFAGGLGNAFVGYFSKRLSTEVAKDRITVNAIHPGETRTDRYRARIEALAAKLGVDYAEAERVKAASIPIGRMVDPIDVASVVLLLVSPVGSAVTGQSIAVDGGATTTVVY